MEHKLSILILIASIATLAVVFTEDIHAQNQETVAITTSIFPITILSGEFIPLLDTSTTGNLTSISVTANLPCDSNDNPLVNIVAGILGDTTGVIDSSSDYVGNGPRDTCVFRDNITNVTAANIPAVNTILLNHTGFVPVHIPQGVMVTLSGVYANQTSTESGSSGPTFSDDFTSYSTPWTNGTGWTSEDTSEMWIDVTADKLNFKTKKDGSHQGMSYNIDTLSNPTNFAIRFYDITWTTDLDYQQMILGVGSHNADTVSTTGGQDFVGTLIFHDDNGSGTDLIVNHPSTADNSAITPQTGFQCASGTNFASIDPLDIEIRYDGSTVTVIWSQDGFATEYCNDTYSTSFTPSGLDEIKILSHSTDAGTGSDYKGIGTIDKIELCDGSTNFDDCS